MWMRRLVSKALIRGLLRAQEGTTAIEYALVASGVSVAIAATVMALGSAVKTNLYDKVSAIF